MDIFLGSVVYFTFVVFMRRIYCFYSTALDIQGSQVKHKSNCARASFSKPYNALSRPVGGDVYMCC